MHSSWVPISLGFGDENAGLMGNIRDAQSPPGGRRCNRLSKEPGGSDCCPNRVFRAARKTLPDRYLHTETGLIIIRKVVRATVSSSHLGDWSSGGSNRSSISTSTT